MDAEGKQLNPQGEKEIAALLAGQKSWAPSDLLTASAATARELGMQSRIARVAGAPIFAVARTDAAKATLVSASGAPAEAVFKLIVPPNLEHKLLTKSA